MAVKNPTQLDFILVNGDFEVHKHNCQDVKRAIKAKVTDYAEPGIINVDPTDTYVDVMRFLWDDQIAEAYDYADDPDQENAILVPATDATEDAEATPEGYLPSYAWLQAHMYETATHFNPCIKQWVSIRTDDCTGATKEWQTAEGLKNPQALECSECHVTAGELGLTPRKRNGKWRPLVPAHTVEVEVLSTPATDSVPAGTKSNGNGKAEAKRLLATMVAKAIAEMLTELANVNMAGDDQDEADYRFINGHFSQEEAAITAATWVHHIPADRERWVAMGLPKPDRSDWRDA
jgi:hypothetical protein